MFFAATLILVRTITEPGYLKFTQAWTRSNKEYPDNFEIFGEEVLYIAVTLHPKMYRGINTRNPRASNDNPFQDNDSDFKNFIKKIP